MAYTTSLCLELFYMYPVAPTCAVALALRAAPLLMLNLCCSHLPLLRSHSVCQAAATWLVHPVLQCCAQPVCSGQLGRCTSWIPKNEAGCDTTLSRRCAWPPSRWACLLPWLHADIVQADFVILAGYSLGGMATARNTLVSSAGQLLCKPVAACKPCAGRAGHNCSSKLGKPLLL